jgi:hypothetical protein
MIKFNVKLKKYIILITIIITIIIITITITIIIIIIIIRNNCYHKTVVEYLMDMKVVE